MVHIFFLGTEMALRIASPASPHQIIFCQTIIMNTLTFSGILIFQMNLKG
jgi:hypothetical protein